MVLVPDLQELQWIAKRTIKWKQDEKLVQPEACFNHYFRGCLRRCLRRQRRDISQNVSFNCLHCGTLLLPLVSGSLIDLCVVLRRRVLCRTISTKVASCKMPSVMLVPPKLASVKIPARSSASLTFSNESRQIL